MQHRNHQGIKINLEPMTNYVNVNTFIINLWVELSKVVANKPTRWQKLLSFFKIKALPEKLYYISATIYVKYPHPLFVGDIFMLPGETLFVVSCRYHRNNSNTEECFRVESLDPVAKYKTYIGEAFIISHAHIQENYKQ